MRAIAHLYAQEKVSFKSSEQRGGRQIPPFLLSKKTDSNQMFIRNPDFKALPSPPLRHTTPPRIPASI